MKVNGAQPARTVTTADETPLAWSSQLENTTDLPLSFEIGTGQHIQQSLSVPVGIKVMKRRELKVTVWHITLTKLDGTDIPPEIQFTKQEVIDELNEVFGKQVNLWATAASVTVHPPQSVVFDLWNPDEIGDPGGNHPPIESGQLDIRREQDQSTSEQDKIANTGRTDSDAHVNVYVVGQERSGLKTWFVENEQASSARFRSSGYTVRRPRQVWLDGQSIQEGQALEMRKKSMLRTMSHEIGHILIGAGHPNNAASSGPAPLSGSRHLWPQRLMFTSPYVTGVEKKMLVKGEWDMIEESMSILESGGIWPPEDEP